MVLLINLNNSLPSNINQSTNKRIALIGPTANAKKWMHGNYFGVAPYLIGPPPAFQAIVQSNLSQYKNEPRTDIFISRSYIRYAFGCDITGN